MNEASTESTPQKRQAKVLIVDDDALARAAVRNVLEREGEFLVCGEATTGVEAVRIASTELPDLIVMDVVMPQMDGISATRQIIASQPDVKIIILAALDDDELGLLALRSGALGFLPKSVNPGILPRILRCMLDGEAAITRALTARLIEQFRSAPKGSEGVRPVRSILTSREWEVLDLLCAHASTGEIAEQLEMSVETVRSHVKRILRKLGVHSRREAIAVAEGLRGGIPGESQIKLAGIGAG